MDAGSSIFLVNDDCVLPITIEDWFVETFMQ